MWKHFILFRHLGIDFISYQENIDTGSPLGEALFTIISAMAQLERDIIRERVKAGLRRAREKGQKLGRPKIKIDLLEAKKLKKEGINLRTIGKRLGVSKSYLSGVSNGCPQNLPEGGLVTHRFIALLFRIFLSKKHLFTGQY